MNRNLAVAMAAVALLAGCAGRANVESVKRGGYEAKLDRCLVAFEPGRLSSSTVASFQTHFVAEFKARGVEASFAQIDDGLTLEKAPPLREQAKAFGATTLLVFIPNGGTVDAYGNVIEARFDARLLEVGNDRMVWRAQVEFSSAAAMLPMDAVARTWVREVATALTADGLLKAAPPKPIDGPRPNAAGWTTPRGT